LKAAIEEFEIINPEHQNRLFVRHSLDWEFGAKTRSRTV
jgi:hypothetical protein